MLVHNSFIWDRIEALWMVKNNLRVDVVICTMLKQTSFHYLQSQFKLLLITK